MNRKQIQLQQNECIVILGRKGCGKSTLAKNLLQNVTKPILIIDTILEYNIGIGITNTKTLNNYFSKHRFIIRISPDEEDFEKIMWWVYKKGNILLLIDEADYWQNPYFIPEGLKQLLRYGRHRNVDIIMISRRPSELNRLSTAMMDKLYCFRITEPIDLQYIGKIDGRLPGLVKKLKNYHYIMINFKTDEIINGITKL